MPRKQTVADNPTPAGAETRKFRTQSAAPQRSLPLVPRPTRTDLQVELVPAHRPVAPSACVGPTCPQRRQRWCRQSCGRRGGPRHERGRAPRHGGHPQQSVEAVPGRHERRATAWPRESRGHLRLLGKHRAVHVTSVVSRRVAGDENAPAPAPPPFVCLEAWLSPLYSTGQRAAQWGGGVRCAVPACTLLGAPPKGLRHNNGPMCKQGPCAVSARGRQADRSVGHWAGKHIAPPPPPCNSYALVQATVGGGTV